MITIKAATATEVAAAFLPTVAMVMLIGCFSLLLIAWHLLHTLGITPLSLGINLFWSKFYSRCLDIESKSLNLLSEF